MPLLLEWLGMLSLRPVGRRFGNFLAACACSLHCSVRGSLSGTWLSVHVKSEERYHWNSYDRKSSKDVFFLAD